MHLVRFIIRIYHDARSPERQISNWSLLRFNPKDGDIISFRNFVTHILDDAVA